ncbi:MAG TPA: SRPBCC domain-containing protein [Bacteroidia bacterium]|nr:SRPBCC domain-containing protein [Bacteroidia bacterium]
MSNEKNKTMSKQNDTKDRELKINRLLNAPIELVWKMWTEPEHIKNWWGPNGFTNSISKMEVKPGGEWEFVMIGPDGTEYKNRNVYKEIIPFEKIVMEHGPSPKFEITATFKARGEKTELTMHGVFESAEQLKEVVEVFKADEGMKQNVDKLEVYLSAQVNLRSQMKTESRSRVSTYLNFPGNTEEAFVFYKSVFKTEFPGNGLTRFGDVAHPEGTPPLTEADKKLILHIELPILGGHILMGTDAPESMGFKMNFGNNVHINLEPETRPETKKLFEALSKGGKVTMELQDMFWGAYFGSCTDKFGVQWMFNCSEK